MDIVYFTVIALGLYYMANALLEWIERKRGARFENRQVVFLAIMLPLTLVTFWLIRAWSGPGA